MSEDPINEILDSMPDSVREPLDGLRRCVTEALGESPEAWRGAEITMALIFHCIEQAPDDATKPELIAVYSQFCAAILDLPAMRAIRARRGD